MARVSRPVVLPCDAIPVPGALRGSRSPHGRSGRDAGGARSARRVAVPAVPDPAPPRNDRGQAQMPLPMRRRRTPRSERTPSGPFISIACRLWRRGFLTHTSLGGSAGPQGGGVDEFGAEPDGGLESLPRPDRRSERAEASGAESISCSPERTPVYGTHVPEQVEARFWGRYSNPKSGWSRLPTGPVIVDAVYRRRWRRLGAALLWTAINPLLFPPPVDETAWLTRTVLAERRWIRGAGNRTVGRSYPNAVNWEVPQPQCTHSTQPGDRNRWGRARHSADSRIETLVATRASQPLRSTNGLRADFRGRDGRVVSATSGQTDTHPANAISMYSMMTTPAMSPSVATRS
jgi:hypothetical protein